MLKKAGIVVAAATACALSVSPLAFAGDYNNDDDNDHKSHHKKSSSNDCEVTHESHNEGDGDGGFGTDNAIQVSVADNLLCKVNALNNVVGIGQKNRNRQ